MCTRSRTSTTPTRGHAGPSDRDRDAGRSDGFSRSSGAGWQRLRALPAPGLRTRRGVPPLFDLSGFRPDVTNPWFPLPVGRTFLYSGVKDGKAASTW